MPVRMTFQDNVQIVIIQGGLTAPEAAAIRLKLDEKIQQGRRLILFDLSGTEIKNLGWLTFFNPLLEFCLTLGITPGVFGLPKEIWGQLAQKGQSRAGCFDRQIDAIRWLIETVAKTPPPPTETPKLSDEEIEKQIKAKHLEELFKQYEVHHLDQALPSLDLDRFLQEYASAPKKSVLREYARAEKEVSELASAVKELRRATQSEADELLALTKLRKFPIAAVEVKARLASLAEEGQQIEKEIIDTETRIQTLLKEIKGFDTGEAVFKAESEVRVQAAERRLQAREMELSEKLRAQSGGGSGETGGTSTTS